LSRLIELQRLIKAQGENGIKLSLEISSTAIALSAACHFAAASETVAHTEFHTIHQVFFDKLNITAIEGRTGWFQLPDSQGLGIVLPKSDIHCEFEMNQASV